MSTLAHTRLLCVYLFTHNKLAAAAVASTKPGSNLSVKSATSSNLSLSTHSGDEDEDNDLATRVNDKDETEDEDAVSSSAASSAGSLTEEEKYVLPLHNHGLAGTSAALSDSSESHPPVESTA